MKSILIFFLSVSVCFADLQSDKAAKEAEIVDIESRIADAVNTITELSEQYTDKLSDLMLVEEQIVNLQAQVDELTTQLQAKVAELGSSTGDQISLTVDVAQLDASIAAYTQKIVDLNNDKTLAKSQLDEINRQIVAASQFPNLTALGIDGSTFWAVRPAVIKFKAPFQEPSPVPVPNPVGGVEESTDPYVKLQNIEEQLLVVDSRHGSDEDTLHFKKIDLEDLDWKVGSYQLQVEGLHGRLTTIRAVSTKERKALARNYVEKSLILSNETEKLEALRKEVQTLNEQFESDLKLMDKLYEEKSVLEQAIEPILPPMEI